MANYQKALKEKEKIEDARRAEKVIADNKLAEEIERKNKIAKIENYKKQQMEYLQQKEDYKLKNNDTDDFKRSFSTNILKNRLKQQVSYINSNINL